MTLDEFFAGFAISRRLFDHVLKRVEAIGPVDVKITKSQVALRSKKTIVIAWVPEKYLQREAAPLVLTFSFPQRDPSKRWKEVVQISPHRFTHHLELYSENDLDAEVLGWLEHAWD